MQATSRNAILYILRELGRRAGATPDWIAKWRIRVQGDWVALDPEPGSAARIMFPFDPFKAARFSQLREAQPGQYSWPRDPGTALTELIPDFVVPFDDKRRSPMPLFTPKDPDTLECRADLITAALWTLCRIEESLPGPTDAHGRFPASASVAFHFGFLDRPIVDEYALAFRQVLAHLLPRWTPPALQLRVKLSHDIDVVGFPRTLSSTVGHLYPRRIPLAFFRDTLSCLGMGNPAYLQAVVQTGRISQETGLDSAFYWKASPRTPWDSGYDPTHPRIRQVINCLVEQGFEMGVHPAYGTFGEPAQLEAEVDSLRRLLGSGPLGGRQHFLRWNPSTWVGWERAGLSYDSSVGFADAMGFRAGTAVPYHPWLLDDDRESALLEIPLIVMDCTPIEYMRLGVDETLVSINTLVRRCGAVGGVFTLLWHNSSVMEPPYASLYPKILSLLRSCGRYDWKADLGTPPLPTIMEDSA